MEWLVQVFLQFERLRHERDDLIRARARSEQIAALEGEMVRIIRQIIGSPQAAAIIAPILQIGRDRVQEALNRARFSPCEAAEPARDVRAALEILEKAIEEWRVWASGLHFTWVPFIGKVVMEHNAPAFQVNRQLVAIRSAFASASEHAASASEKYLRVRDVRARLGGQPGLLPAPPDSSLTTIVAIPDGMNWSEGKRLQEARRSMLQVADQIEQALRQASKRLEQAAYDKDATMVRPEAVAESLADLNYIIVCGVVTVATLVRLVSGLPAGPQSGVP